MSLEASIKTLLADVAGGRVYPDVAPDTPVFPLVIYQQIGGVPLWFSEKAMPDKKNARLQISVWATSRLEASTIARDIERRMCEWEAPTEPFGALTALYEEAIKKYGTRQDFGVWYPDP